MGKAIGGLPEAPPLSGEASPGRAGVSEPEPIGAYLARQRRLRGITLDELAELTRIPRRSLERLEAGVFDGRPDGFVRGFVRTVAQGIGLDPLDTVSRMLPEPGVRPRRAWPRVGRVLLAVCLVAGAAGLAFVAVALWRDVAAPTAAPALEPSLAVRRDAVRALAISHGLVPREHGASPAASGLAAAEHAPASPPTGSPGAARPTAPE